MTVPTKNRTRCPLQVLGLLIAAGLSFAWLPASPAAAQSLEEALATAYSSNPTLLGARAELRSVNEGVPQELSNWRPRVTVTGTAGRQRTDSKGTFGSGVQKTKPLTAELALSQPIYRGGRTVAGTARAEADVQAQRARLVATEQSVLLNSVTAYTDVWRDQSILQLNINNEQVLKRQLEASQDRFAVGEITRTDVAQSESRLARATADRVASLGSLTSSRAVFQQIIGIYPEILKQPAALSDLPRGQEEVVRAAMSNNPDLVSAKFRELSATNQVRVNIGQLLPVIDLTGELSYAEESGSLEDSEVKTARVLAQVTIPLYQQGLVSSQVRRSKQVASQRRLEISESRRSVEQNAISAWENLQTARAQISSFRAAVQSSQIALEGVRQENAVGARTVLDVLDAEQELLDTQVSLVGSQRDEIVARYAVLSAMGRLTAASLKLPVEIYNPVTDYRAVRDSWLGLGAPGE